jgi:hypothetical protein
MNPNPFRPAFGRTNRARSRRESLVVAELRIPFMGLSTASHSKSRRKGKGRQVLNRVKVTSVRVRSTRLSTSVPRVPIARPYARLYGSNRVWCEVSRS